MQVLNIFHVLIAIALVAFVLIQKGQGATAGAAFGSGASGTVFGARGAGNFLTRATWVLAALFCAISLAMAVMVSRINAAPEENLGVVAATEPAIVEETQPGPDASLISDEPVDTDMPAFEAPQSDLPEMELNTEEAAQPVVDEGGAAAGEAEEDPDSGQDSG